MISTKQPLSPHLQVYRPQLTSVLSLLHRGSGLFLALGTVVLVWWLVCVAAGPEAYLSAWTLMSSWPGQLLLLIWSAALFYHLCNGVRHLFWDIGLGYELKSAYASGYAVLLATLVLTAATWIAALAGTGA